MQAAFATAAAALVWAEWLQQIVIRIGRLLAMPPAASPPTPAPLSRAPANPSATAPTGPVWLVRPRSDGGCDYVNFVASHGLVEIREGSHLPPQMPLLKRRRQLGAAEAEACRHSFQQEAGFRHSDPLF